MEMKDPMCSIWNIYLKVAKHIYIYMKTFYT